MEGQWKVVTAGEKAIQHAGPSNNFIGNFVVQGANMNFNYGNNHFGPINIQGDSVSIGPLGSTMMYVDIQPSEN